MSSRNPTPSEESENTEPPEVIHIHQEPLDELLSGWWDTTITGDIEESGFEFTLVEDDDVDYCSQHSSDKVNEQHNCEHHSTVERKERLISNE